MYAILLTQWILILIVLQLLTNYATLKTISQPGLLWTCFGIALLCYIVLANISGWDYRFKAPVLIIATMAQVLFITGLSEVHPGFLLVAIGVLGYPTALVA